MFLLTNTRVRRGATIDTSDTGVWRTGTVHCAGSATYQICFRLPIPKPNPITDPNLTLKLTKKKTKRHRNEIEHRVISKSRFPREGGFLKGL